MKLSLQLALSMTLGSAALLAACGSGDERADGADENGYATDSDDAALDGDSDLGSLDQALSVCETPDPIGSTLAALATAAAAELGRWQPSQDFAIGKVGANDALVLTSVGKSRCADKVCVRTQALLDIQKDEAKGQVVLPGKVVVDPAQLRQRLVAKYREQATCDAKPANGVASSCPVEEHALRIQRADSVPCGMDYTLVATQPGGQPLKYSAQLPNKLLWADRNNLSIRYPTLPSIYIASVYELGVSYPPESPPGCTSACVKVSATDMSGQCCICNGATKAYKRAPFSSMVYLCQ